jgi:hypothetical protein
MRREPRKYMCDRFRCPPAGNGLSLMAEATSPAGAATARNCFTSLLTRR